MRQLFWGVEVQELPNRNVSVKDLTLILKYLSKLLPYLYANMVVDASVQQGTF